MHAGTPEFVKRLAVLKVYEAMIHNNGNVAKSAKALGVSRYTVYRLLAWDEERIEKEMNLQ